jgi:uncharacterized protein (TIGR03067 family)
MRCTWLASMQGALLLLAVIALAAQPNALEKDQKALEGKWNVVSHIKDGQDRLKELGKTTVTFDGNKISIAHDNGNTEDATFALDPNKTPKEIDILPGKDQKVFGIYEVKDNELKVCFRDPDSNERPKQFVADKNSSLVTLKRIGK